MPTLMNVNLHSFLVPLIGVVAIVWIMYRQSSWQPVDPAQMWRMVLVLAAVGVYLLVRSDLTVTGADIGVVVIEFVVSIAAGVGMGAIAMFRPVTAETQQQVAARGRAPRAPITAETRTGAWGLVIWLVLIVVRVGIEVASHRAGLGLASATGVFFVVLAANRAARLAVLTARYERIQRERVPVTITS
ncbi:hypothetical protein AAG589_11465 [Isoptericola sp. F-RaC21]|uniref:hypothetical protein n=1 Tax=Isoptericola sp. F-RaC21 TaxID=3141452 RepID=UPI00315B8B2D